jgi:ubiquinone/menaquinone biosynthesis C-methylase UbiE
LDRVLGTMDLLGMRRWRRASAAGLRGLALEVGAGTGRNSGHIPKGVRLVAVEPDEDSLRYRQQRHRALGSAVVARAEALPFRDGVFDSALMTLVMCSVDDQRAAAGELHRVLRSGAELFAVDHVISRQPIARRIQVAWAPAWYRRTGSCRIDRDTLGVLTEAGFRVRPEARRVLGAFVRYRAARPER